MTARKDDRKTNRTIDGCVCPQCGRRFDVVSPRDWGYRQGSIYYCSWKCIREFDAGIAPHPETNAPKASPMTPEQLEKFETKDKRVRKKLQRQCAVMPAPEKREPKAKRQVRAGTTDEEKKRLVLDCQRLMAEKNIPFSTASRDLGVSPSTMDNWLRRFRDELGIEKTPNDVSGSRRWSKHPESKRAADPRTPNLSGEKIRRIMETVRRIHRLLDETREEADGHVTA